MLRKKFEVKLKIFTGVFLAVVFFAGGCATTGVPTAGMAKARQNFITINNAAYLSLPELCSAQGFFWDWDGFSRIVVLEKSGMEIRIYPGSALAVYNGEVRDLGEPVKIYKGMIMVPAAFLRIAQEKKIPPLKEKQRQKTITIKRVIIDAGHGGKDPGALGRKGVDEKNIVLDIAKRLKSELEKNNIEVVLTRDSDEFVELCRRSEIANNAKADFFISIHANASRNPSVRGVEVYYLSNEYDDFSKAVQMRENAAIEYEENPQVEKNGSVNTTIWDMMLAENRIEAIEMANDISSGLRKILNLNTRHVKGAMFYVLKGAQMPAILLEVGYITNKQEFSNLCNYYYRQMLAEAVANGILHYKERFESSNGFTR